MGTRVLSKLLMVALGVLTSQAGAQTGGYEVVDLGTLPAHPYSNAHGINASGQITGECTNDQGFPTGFVWTEGTGMVALTFPNILGYESWGINDFGTITGISGDTSLRLHAYILQSGVLTDIHPTGQRSSGWTLNNANDVVGWRDVNGIKATAFLRQGNGNLILGPLDSELFDITDADESHGVRASGYWPDPTTGAPMATVYDLDTNSALLTSIPGEARGINQAGTIVGSSGDLAFLCTVENNYGSPVFLQPLPGYTRARFYEINDHGVAVGTSLMTTTPLSALIYGRGVLQDIHALLDPVSGEGWTITYIRDINNEGWMVGLGTKNGLRRGVLLRPTDVDGDGLSYHDERFIYATNPELADTDGDGLNDDAELDLETNPLVGDTDGDGALDGAEVTRGTSPLLPDRLTVTRPNGGETIARGTLQTITWNTEGAVGANVKILSRKGTSFGTIVATTPNDGSYEWLVPLTFPLGTNNIVEISSVSLPTILDKSNAFFTTVANDPISGTITVLSPNGGESLLRGSTFPITWSNTGYIGGAVKIVLRKGTTATVLASSTANDGSFDWTIPNFSLGTGYTVEISAVLAPTIIDASNAVFSLTDTPPPSGSITVIAPNGGETYLHGGMVPVTWSSAGAVGSNVQILAHGAGQHFTVVASTVNDGAFEWTIPATQAVGTDYTIEVRSVTAPSIGDSSNAAFTIATPPPAPTITVIAPNGGESYLQGATVPITWSSTGDVVNDVQIFAHGAGQNFTLALSTPNDGAFDWIVPAAQAPGTNYTIEVRSVVAPEVGDSSNATFSIVSPPPPPSASITVLSPNGGESLARGTTVEITWTSTGSIGANVKIVARKGTASSTLAGGTPNDGSYSWKIPATYPLGSGVTIEISSVATPSIIDTSNATFTIINPPTATAFAVTVPSGGESYFPGQTVPVSWVSAGTSASKVHIVARSGGQTYIVANATENDGSFAWAMPRSQTPGYDYAIEVIPVGPSPITVISPNGGETLVRGATIPIVWTSTSEVGASVKIVARKGTYGSVLASVTPNDGNYSWKIPATYPVGPGVTIEISSVANPVLMDASNGPFTIGS